MTGDRENNFAGTSTGHILDCGGKRSATPLYSGALMNAGLIDEVNRVNRVILGGDKASLKLVQTKPLDSAIGP
jgi:hypothetical protein